MIATLSNKLARKSRSPIARCKKRHKLKEKQFYSDSLSSVEISPKSQLCLVFQVLASSYRLAQICLLVCLFCMKVASSFSRKGTSRARLKWHKFVIARDCSCFQLDSGFIRLLEEHDVFCHLQTSHQAGINVEGGQLTSELV